jgi:hypothetical protein
METEVRVEIDSKTEVGAAEALMGERLLWTAVLKRAVDDWRDCNLRQRREAQKFLFEEPESLAEVCSAAGLETDRFRTECLRIGRKVDMQAQWHPPLAA